MKIINITKKNSFKTLAIIFIHTITEKYIFIYKWLGLYQVQNLQVKKLLTILKQGMAKDIIF